MTYTYQTPFTYVYDKFEYFAEDFDCVLCMNYKSRAADRDKRYKTKCGLPVCEFEDLKDEAIRHNRIRRPKGWNKPCVTV
jgi:hypothetical protein